MDLLTALVTGATLGLAGGLSPGPLTALVLSQSLRHGPREGAKVALAPVITDGPLLLLGALLAGAAAQLSWLLAGISLAGAAFVAWLGVDALRTEGVEVGEAEAGSVWKAVAVNVLNPHPWLFWLVVGGPLVARAWELGWGATGAFLLGFFGLLCGSKLALALAASRARAWLQGRAYIWVMRGLGLGLLVFAAGFAWEAWRLLSE